MADILAIYKEILLCVMIFFMYVFLVSYVYPKCFLRARYEKTDVKDRGVKKYVFEDGRAILYEPSLSCRKYIKQYILSVNQGKKHIKCRIDDRIVSIKYEAAVFDAKDRLIKVIEICEPIRSAGESSAVPLPPQTSFVSVNVREINGVAVDTGKTLSLPFKNLIWFTVSTVVTSVLQAMFVWLKIKNYYANYSFRPEGSPNILPVILASALIGALVSLVIIILNTSESVKIKD